MSTSKALAAWKLFLETTPPNTSVKISWLAKRRRASGYMPRCVYEDAVVPVDEFLPALAIRR